MENHERQLTVSTTVEETTARVTITGELDVDSAPQVADELTALADREVTAVVVDVAGLIFVDSTGLRAILAGRETLQRVGATLVLHGATGVVERVLDMTGLKGLLAEAGETSEPAS
jgi:anti-anti-sigma factor